MKLRIFLRRLLSSKSEFQAWKTHRLEELTNAHVHCCENLATLKKSFLWCKKKQSEHICQSTLASIDETLNYIKKEADSLFLQLYTIQKELTFLLSLP